MNEPEPFAQSKRSVERERAIAWEEAARVAEQRDNLTTRIRFGLATLNGTSIIALVTAAGGAGNFLDRIGFSPVVLTASLSFFALGTIAAGISSFSHQNELVVHAGYARARAMAFNQARMLLDRPIDEHKDDKYLAAIETAANCFKVTLETRPIARWAQSCAAGAWLAGILCPALNAMFRLWGLPM